MWKELAISVISVVVAFLGLLIGESFWERVGIRSEELRNGLVLLGPILIIFIGFLFSMYSLFERNMNAIPRISDSLLTEFKRAVPTLETLTRFEGREGLSLISRKIHSAAKVLNTRLIPGSFVGSLYDTEALAWNRSIVQAVAHGLDFVDIVSGKGCESAEDIAAELEARRLRASGQYTAATLSLPFESMLNFKLLYFKDGSSEVWFGWRISASSHLDEVCFRSSDRDLVSLFENWHHDLFRSAGTSVESIPAGRSLS